MSYLIDKSCWKRIGEPKTLERGISRPLACCAVCGSQGVFGGVFVKKKNMPKDWKSKAV